MKTRILSLVVALVLMLCAIPCAFAEESHLKAQVYSSII